MSILRGEISSSLPTLTIVPIANLLLHEKYDDSRTPRIIEDIKNSKVLRNPPIVTPLMDGSSRYMVLDGANRTTAFQKMGFPHGLVQIIDIGVGSVALTPWKHILWGVTSDELMLALNGLTEITIVAMSEPCSEKRMQDTDTIASLHLPDRQVFCIQANTDSLFERNAVLNKVVDAYQAIAFVDRTMIDDIAQLKQLYPEMSGLFVLPSYTMEEVLLLSGEEQLVPAGTTRFTVSPRALHVNYPLSRLMEDKSVEMKNAELQNWVKMRLSQKGVRYYEETTFLFDE